MVHLSIVVPVTGPQSQLDETLVSILENRPNDCEVILVHPESYVDPYDLGDEVRFVVTPSAALLSMVNAGFAASRGELIHLLCPGGIATAGWCEPACDMFRDNRNVATLAPQLNVRGKRIIRGIAYDPAYGKKLVRKRSAFPLMPTRLAGFYQSSALRFL